VDDVVAIDTLAVIDAISLVAPIVVGLLPRLPVPQVVLLLLGGILVGPDVLDLGGPEDVRLLADVGLGFVFLLAGYEIDLRSSREDAGRRAVVAWTVSLGLAVGVVGLLSVAGLVQAPVPVALGLTTTALGTLLPVLREKGLLHGRLGRYLLATGEWGSSSRCWRSPCSGARRTGSSRWPRSARSPCWPCCSASPAGWSASTAGWPTSSPSASTTPPRSPCAAPSCCWSR